ncbi:MAG: hypothetical protein LBR32_07880 [Propionibacteriaceae bacterium]|nr:hypothetical protein [Propionibacteriaceae bacterium]
MPVLEAVAARFGRDDLAAVFPEADIPVLSGAQRQGDILVVPCPSPCRWPSDARPLAGQDVARQPDGGHEHVLYGDGEVLVVADMSPQRAMWWQTEPNTAAWLRVPDGGEAFLMHPEHGALGIGPGVYEVRSQMEYAPEGFWVPAGD